MVAAHSQTGAQFTDKIHLSVWLDRGRTGTSTVARGARKWNIK